MGSFFRPGEPNPDANRSGMEFLPLNNNYASLRLG